MVSRARIVLVVLIVALGVAALAAWFGWRREGDPALALLMGLAAATFVLFAALAVDLLLRAGERPDRDDITALVALQRRIDYRLDATDARISRSDRMMTLIALEPGIAAADEALAAASARVEQWQDPAADLSHWRAARERWIGAAARLGGEFVPSDDPAAGDEWSRARDRLPAARNFSSQDLRAATDYYAQAARIDAARDRLHAHARAIIAAIERIDPA